MITVGISAFYHDAACCLMRDGQLVAAAEEERFTRVKHDRRLPLRAFEYCLDASGVSIADVDVVAYYERPRDRLHRILWAGLPDIPISTPATLFQLDPRQMERGVREVLGYDGPIWLADHHLSHAASAFLFSGFDSAAILTADGVGEWTTGARGFGTGGEIELTTRSYFPHSLGLLYSTVTTYLGFAANDGEYKVMGLAPYGTPVLLDRLYEMAEITDDGDVHLSDRHFDFSGRGRMFTDAFEDVIGMPPRAPGSHIDQPAADLAASVQALLERALVRQAEVLHAAYASPNLCMAGGIALNCVANSRVLRQTRFTRLFVQPAASDAGGALGAASLASIAHGAPRPTRMAHAAWGPAFGVQEVRRLLVDCGVEFVAFEGRLSLLMEHTARALADGAVVGWFQGAMEFGPRALGQRSILADPRRPDMRDRINALIKQREAFRPFAPAVLEEHADRFFELDHPSPFMLEAVATRDPATLPAVTHVDGSARVQTVSRERNPRFGALLDAFAALTGCPVLLNTSFNQRNEPIACMPADALRCFAAARLDLLVIEDFVIEQAAISDAMRNAAHRASPSVRGPTADFYAML